MRTTLDLEKPVLQGLKALQKKDKRSLGRIASDLLAEALAKKSLPVAKSKFAWNDQSMNARVNLADKDSVYRILDQR